MDIMEMFRHYVWAIIFWNAQITQTEAIPYPRESETREVLSLDGLWNFFQSKDFSKDKSLYKDDLNKVRKTILMPVPASYNDITTDRNLRDHVGDVWYDRKFFVPEEWSENTRVWIRFGSVHYLAIVYINGHLLTRHEMGHLPFEIEIKTNLLHYGKENRISVDCSNVLKVDTIPQGSASSDQSGRRTQTYTFDFFNYAGIHRSVHLYTTPVRYIKDVKVTSDIDKSKSGILNYKVTAGGIEGKGKMNVRAQLVSKEGIIVANSSSNSNFAGNFALKEKDTKLWWPYLMNAKPGYLYQLEIFLSDDKDVLYDIYRLPVGIRKLKWNNKQFTINGKPLYFRGLGKHEDSDIRGKGLDLPYMIRDFNLLKWLGVNTYRTSHYPYSEESMQFADANGIMIIDECASVDADQYSNDLFVSHKAALKELIERDSNHPSVVMWSIANEPRTKSLEAGEYFKMVADHTRGLDSSRPITASIAVPLEDDRAAEHLDIISFNRYNAWYSDPGKLYVITAKVINEAKAWHEHHNKPIVLSEYGADTLEGLHVLPSFIWSEEYQSELLSEHFKAFDDLRQNSWFLGEFVWNFADFKTDQGYTRVSGNKKGIFTRNRQPKAAAHVLRKRYLSLGNELDKAKLPSDLYRYIAG